MIEPNQPFQLGRQGLEAWAFAYCSVSVTRSSALLDCLPLNGAVLFRTMKFIPIKNNDCSKWREMREKLYSSLSIEFHDEEMEKILNSKEWNCRFVEDKNGQVIGFLELSYRNNVDGCLSSPVAYLEGLYLEPEFREKGLGREIINVLLNWCNEHGFSELATDTELQNIDAQGFFEALGFQETYRVVEYRIDVVKT